MATPGWLPGKALCTDPGLQKQSLYIEVDRARALGLRVCWQVGGQVSWEESHVFRRELWKSCLQPENNNKKEKTKTKQKGEKEKRKRAGEQDSPA